MDDLDYSTICVSGADAFDFLQAQLAGDLARLGDNPKSSDELSDENQQRDLAESILSAWCNPKGRVICLFRVAKSGEDYLLTLPTELADPVVKRLTMFRFRSQVEFSVEPATREQLGVDGSVDDWRLANLRAGIPEIGAAQSEQFTPHMLNLDLLGAASVDKGCYPGQEIVARTHFRGATKRRMLRFECSGRVAAGDKVSDGERDVGEVVNSVGGDLLAVVPLAKQNQQLTVKKAVLVSSTLPYL